MIKTIKDAEQEGILENCIYNADCLDLMRYIKSKSIDMIFCDLPYGTTACKWDTIIPLEPLWEQYKRIIKDNGAIVLTASQPFTSALVMSNIKMFKYEWIWEKSRPNGFLDANRKPMKKHENILVFYNKLPVYNPQGIILKDKPNKTTGVENVYGKVKQGYQAKITYTNYPNTILEFASNTNEFHPTQKPVALFEYLIKTYTSVGDTILDNCIGSGTTAVAAINTGRNFIGIEMDKGYCDIANKRIQEAREKLASKLPL
jgi:site-specific DNA-methyltransferase (adenine-specific)